MLELRLLDPIEDIELFREAYNWRPHPKRHAQTNRAPFESFISDDPRQMVIGLFNDQFIAAFVLYEFDPQRYECHFTSRRGSSKETLIEGGKQIRDACLQNGAKELCAWVTKRNLALKAYLESLGFSPAEEKEFDGKPFIRYRVARVSTLFCS